MADRTVLVRLKADIAQYQAGMQRAKQSTQEFGRELTGQGKTSQVELEKVGRGALLVGGALAFGFGKAVQVGMRFEKSMSGVQAVSGATSEEMHKLSDAAIAAGASQTLAGVTASDAAAAEAELVRAGVSVSDVLGGALVGSLTLASAGQIDFANAATIAAQSMNIFDMSGRDVTHIADVLAAAANKSAADVDGLGESLRQGGLVASQTGLSFEETVGTLAAFADNALIGSDAGTSLKTMLQRLTPISGEAASLMEELGFSAYDAEGNFIGLEGLAEELQTTLGGMTVEQRNLALATMFGSDAIRGANILYEEGAEGMHGYITAVNDQGAAARMAAIQNDNLAGDIETLGGAIESAILKNGSQANDVLRTMVGTVTGLVTGFSSMPGLLQGGALGLGAVATAGTLAVGVVGTLAPKAYEARDALAKMGTSGAFMARNMKTMIGAVAAAGAGFAVVAAWEGMLAGARTEAEKWSATWKVDAFASSADGLAAYKQKLSDVNFEWSKMSSEAHRARSAFGGQILDAQQIEQLQFGADVLEGIGGEMGRVSDLSDEMASSFGISGDAAMEWVLAQQSAGVDILSGDYNDVAASLRNTFREMNTGTVASQQLNAGMDALGGEVASVEEQVKAFGETLDALFNQFFGAEEAQDAFQQGLNELDDVILETVGAGLEFKDVLTGQSDEAITFRGHMRDMVSGASDLIAEWQEQGVTGDELRARINYLSQSFRDQMVAAGLPGPVVDHYLGLLGAIPIAKNTSIHAQDAASGVIRHVNRQLDNLPRRITIQIAGQVLGGDKQFMPQFGHAAGGFVYRAAGGPVYRAAGGPMYRATGGVGPRGTDTVPAWLTPGEYVIKASAVSAIGLPVLNALNGMSAGGGVTGMGGNFSQGAGGGTTTFVDQSQHFTIHASSIDAHHVGRAVRDAVVTAGRRGIAA